MKLTPNWKRLTIVPALTLGLYGGMGLASYQDTGSSLPVDILKSSGPMPLELSLIQKMAAVASPNLFQDGIMRGIDAAYADLHHRDPIDTSPITNPDQIAGFNAGFTCFDQAAQAVRRENHGNTPVAAMRDPEARVKTQAIHIHSQCKDRAALTAVMVLPKFLKL